MPTPSTGFQPVKSADRALQILEALGRERTGMSLTDLQRQLGIPKSSLHGLLRTLAQREWIETDDAGTRFTIGRRAVWASAAYIEKDETVEAAKPIIDWLSAETGETVHLGRLDGDHILYLSKRDSRHPLRMYSAVGRRLPAHATALGKALLARRTDTQVDEMLPNPLPGLTANTLTSRDALFEDLDVTRERGYAFDNEENAQGIVCFAVALLAGFPPTDAISISIPTAHLTPELQRDVVQLLKQAQERFTTETSWLPAP